LIKNNKLILNKKKDEKVIYYNHITYLFIINYFFMENTVGRNHLAPNNFTYIIKVYTQSQFLSDLLEEECNFIGNIGSPNGEPYIINGLNKINNTEVWIVNQEKQGYYYFWFKNKNDAITLFNVIEEKKKLKQNTAKNTIYKFTKTGWKHVNKFQDRNPDDLIGYTHYLKTINKDINNYNNFIDFLKSIGEGYRTLNYLLYGPPGTGKTTLIKTLASMNNYPIYIVNASLMDNVNASDVLNPKVATGQKNKIILFEDFDRYLKEGKFNMSEILNELDGIESTEGCIRFFTCNDIEEIKKHDALINRMNSKFSFDYPENKDFINKLNRLLTFLPVIDQEKKNKFINLFFEKITSENKITLRPFTSYIIRYLFDSDCLDKLIENIDELKT
jgi:AAA+ superfamily predicted ATPase